MEALKRTVREYERQLQQAKVSAEDEMKRAEADRTFAQKHVSDPVDDCNVHSATISNIATTNNSSSTTIVITVIIITASANACLAA